MLIQKLAAVMILVVLIVATAFAQEEAEEERVYDYAEQNHQCLKCHGHKTFHYFNENVGQEIRERMNPYYIIDSVEFYSSNHWNFSCLDCHSYEYETTFPHPNELRMEPLPVCLDCHSGDDTYEDRNWEQIDEEFQKSVHSTKHGADFKCSMCHNPHSYKINARTNENIKETIQYDNGICLSCHADINKYQLIVDFTNPNVLETHSWLPNQALHWQNVRCIECHVEINENMLVAHNVQPKEKAVRKCVECHSENSILLASLYKHQVKESRSELGFFNAAILNNSYIIGANRNYYLNVISLVFFGLVLGGIGIHAIIRIIKK
ncbi:MAG: cytochrome c3 family protein [Bacteroidales bacterium]